MDDPLHKRIREILQQRVDMGAGINAGAYVQKGRKKYIKRREKPVGAVDYYDDLVVAGRRKKAVARKKRVIKKKPADYFDDLVIAGAKKNVKRKKKKKKKRKESDWVKLVKELMPLGLSMKEISNIYRQAS